MSWVASATVVAVGLLCMAFLMWLVRREAARWQRFRHVQGEPEVVAERVAANAERRRFAPLKLMVFRSATKRWEPAGETGSRRQPPRQEREPSRGGKRRPRGNATVSCWPAIVL